MSREREVGTDEIRPLTQREFDQFRKLAYDIAGIDLQPGKEQLVSGRINKKLRELRISSYQDYYRHVTEDKTGDALIAMIDALTTNHTSFFREPAHFDFLRKTILPPLRKRERINFWCAASATGEEAYSIAFSVLDELGMDALPKLNILATDISTRVLATARKGIYTAERFCGIPVQQLRQYLLRGHGKCDGWYQVRKEIRTAIRFERLNLIDQFTHRALFPAIFCRNVMIYFDRPTQEQVVKRLTHFLEPGGYLLIGHAESLNGSTHSLQYVCPATYRKPLPGESISTRTASKR
jgi:chemotaxis protein methyltransferase CheR